MKRFFYRHSSYLQERQGETSYSNLENKEKNRGTSPHIPTADSLLHSTASYHPVLSVYDRIIAKDTSHM